MILGPFAALTPSKKTVRFAHYKYKVSAEPEEMDWEKAGARV